MIVAFIPVRCGRKSIPLKNIKRFCGKPLVYWTLESLQNTLQVERIVLATDCNEIMEVVKGFNFSKVEIFERSTENANDTASTESVVLEFIAQGDIADSDLFLLVQATSPFTKNKDFELAINNLHRITNLLKNTTNIKQKKSLGKAYYLLGDVASFFNLNNI